MYMRRKACRKSSLHHHFRIVVQFQTQRAPAVQSRAPAAALRKKIGVERERERENKRKSCYRDTRSRETHHSLNVSGKENA